MTICYCLIFAFILQRLTFLIEVLVREEAQGDGGSAWLDGEVGDVGMEAAITVDADIGWFFAVDGDRDGLWFDLGVVKWECCYSHESSCVTIQIDDRSAVFVSICSGPYWSREN